jgi:hypothetical protein
MRRARKGRAAYRTAEACHRDPLELRLDDNTKKGSVHSLHSGVKLGLGLITNKEGE